ncbi:ATP-dependent DNA helicase [Oleomonas cavernae]|uniref:ATP-dependent DNA helicase n=1 Tax=Oleomonas cavernae TaxID=2320859 RepID=UPI0038D14DBF
MRDAVGRQSTPRPLPDWTALADAATATDSCPAKREVRQRINEALVGFDLGGAEPQALQRQVLARHFIDLEIEGDRRSASYSTQAVIEAERSITRIGPRIAARPDRRLALGQVEQALQGTTCDVEQSRAVRAATAGQDLAVIEGPAGAGKSTLLRPIIQAYRDAGYAPIVTAPAWKVAEALGEAVETPYEVLATLVGKNARPSHRIGPASVVIVDEAGMVGARTMGSLLGEVERAGAKIILVGDRQQLKPVEAGPALSLLMDHIPAACHTELREVRRQHSVGERVQALRWRAQSPDAAMDAIEHARANKTWHGVETAQATIDTAVTLWAGLERDDEHAVVLARSNAEARAINERIRKLRREAGEIADTDHLAVAADQSGTLFELALARGDRVRITRKIAGKSLINGTEGTIREVKSDTDGMLTITLMVDDEIISVTHKDLRDPVSGGIKLAHAYAATVHSAQGATVDHTIIVAASGTRRWDANLAYVAASRHRAQCHWVVNEAPCRTSKNGQDPTEQEVMMRMATDLARPAEKASALARIELLMRQRDDEAAAIAAERPDSLNFLGKVLEDRYQDKVARALQIVVANLQNLVSSLREAIEKLRPTPARSPGLQQGIQPRARARDDDER